MSIINLDNYINRTVDFEINGKLVKVQEPTPKIYIRIAKYEQIEDAVEIFQEQISIITEILNRNTSGVKFTEKEVENYPQSILNTVMQETTSLRNRAVSDPN